MQVSQTVPNLLQCVPFHVRALVAGTALVHSGKGNKRSIRSGFFHLMDDSHLGPHDEDLRIFCRGRVLEQAGRAANMVRVGQ